MKARQGRQVYRLIYVASSSQEVVERYRERLQELQEAGFEVHILASDDGGLPALAQDGFIVRPLPIGRRYNVPGTIGAYFICQAYFLEHPPTLVHAFGHRGALSAVFAAHQAGVPAIFMSLERHLAGLDEEGSRLHRALAEPVQRAYRTLSQMVDRYLVEDEETCLWVEEQGISAPPKLAYIEGEGELFELYDEVLEQALEVERGFFEEDRA